MSLITSSLVHAKELLSGVTAHSSGSDGHVVPVAGWPLGTAVAAQVLVDASHLVAGHVVRHLQVRVAAVRLCTAHVVKQVLAVHNGDLHNDQFALGTAVIVELLSKTQSHCWIRSRDLTLLIQL